MTVDAKTGTLPNLAPVYFAGQLAQGQLFAAPEPPQAAQGQAFLAVVQQPVKSAVAASARNRDWRVFINFLLSTVGAH